ncbi:hypothetical protein [Allonocardiopsis opalescens]|uniref:Uncharacterized protein n=1 Tax=Allonocardiopsis opalescens TaxID=1144618 RepID=A0A2T0QA73_9ACTN|nr:hypothetical protein [Allonocardiopsis opalescens]PRY00711.1 hypothetical protein CLV72_102343 [Allonocardiopsis opalescens]
MSTRASARALWRRLVDRLRGRLGRPIDLGRAADPAARVPGRPRTDRENEPLPPWPDPAEPERPLQVTVHARPDTVRFESPAAGDGHVFVIEVRCYWCAQVTILDESLRESTEARLRRSLARHRTEITDRVIDLVRPLARRYQPFQAAELEEALSTRLAGCFDDGEVQCTTRSRVDVSEPVRELLVRVGNELIKLDGQGRYQVARIAQLRMLRYEWEELLLDALKGAGEVDDSRATWLAPYALSLAETPEHATERLAEMLQERQSATVELFNDLSEIISTNREGELDQVSFMMSSDHIFREMLKQLGLPVPARDRGNGTAVGEAGHAR